MVRTSSSINTTKRLHPEAKQRPHEIHRYSLTACEKISQRSISSSKVSRADFKKLHDTRKFPSNLCPKHIYAITPPNYSLSASTPQPPPHAPSGGKSQIPSDSQSHSTRRPGPSLHLPLSSHPPECQYPSLEYERYSSHIPLARGRTAPIALRNSRRIPCAVDRS